MRHDPDFDPSDDAPFPADPALDAALGRWAARAPDSVDVEGALARVTARRQAEDAASGAVPALAGDDLAARRARRETVPARHWRRPASIAAAAALLLAAGTLLLRQGGTAGEPVRRLATATGMVDSLALADGTRIVVGPRSTLVVEASADARTVRLEGEATFHVTHDASRPFTVRTAAGDVVDLGTVFTVRGGDAPTLHVRVTEGEVELRPAADRAHAARLRAGDVARLADARLVVERGVAVPRDAEALGERRLAFREASLDEVATTLARWYGVRLDVTDPVLRVQRVTADYTAEAPRSVVRLLALALGAEATWRGDTVTLRAVPAVRP